jgi:hypothetical protein
MTQIEVPTDKVEIQLNGEKRLVRDKVTVSMALFEIGQNRPEDHLICPDGSCGLCQISVDGAKKLACQTHIHPGIAIKTTHHDNAASASEESPAELILCPCLNLSQKSVLERVKSGKLQSPEAVISVTQIGEGKCHGQICLGPFKRMLMEQGVPAASWIDWRFPWSDWVLPYR